MSIGGRHVLVVRLDSLGDMLVSGPAIRAVAAGATRVTVLAGPDGAAAARLLPGVDDVLVWRCPWILADPPPVDQSAVLDLVRTVAECGIDEAVVLTSFHQSALPSALLLRLAGIPRVTAVSEDYPGSLLDVRLPAPPDAPESERMLAIVHGAGFVLPRGDDGRLQVHTADEPVGLPPRPFVVVHPGASAPARAYPADRWAAVVALLTAAGRTVLVTGSATEAELTSIVCSAAEPPGNAVDCAGRFDLPALAAVLRRSAVLAVANTGPAHLAAAVGTPVVSLFAPVVPAERWAPHGVRVVLLGDQHAPCVGSRARTCPIPGHPCLTTVPPAQVNAAVDRLAPVREQVPA